MYMEKLICPNFLASHFDAAYNLLEILFKEFVKPSELWILHIWQMRKLTIIKWVSGEVSFKPWRGWFGSPHT